MYKQLKRKLKVLTSRDGCEVFNVGRATQWAFADGLGDNLKDDPDPETIGLAVLILRQVSKSSLCRGFPIGIIDRVLGGH